jgi:small subunit ribosomal protein S6
MATYEMMLVLDPEMSKEQVDGFVEKLKQSLGDRGAEVLKVEEWGLQTLAYEIKKKNKGYYLLLYIDGDVALVSEMERTLRLMEEVLRYLTVKAETGDTEALQQGEAPEPEEEPEQEPEKEPEPAETPEQKQKPEDELADDQKGDVAAEEA